MKKNLRWKLILIGLVIVLSVFLAYPPGSKIALGLDLQGGMHLVMQVMTDDAIDSETDNEILRLQDRFKRKNIQADTIAKPDGTIGVFEILDFSSPQASQIRELLDEEFKEWDISSGDNAIRASFKSNILFYLRDQAVRQAMQTLRNRVDELGLSEIPVQRQGTGERIIVELPGVENPDRVKNILKTTAMLEWKLVHAGPAATVEELTELAGGQIPEDQEILEGDPNRGNEGFFLLSKVAAVTGKDLRSARRTTDEWNAPAISFTLNPDAGRRFATFTGENVGKPLSIILDNKVQEVANIKERIPDGGGIIHGSYSMEEADDLALVLRAGALPAEIKYLEERTIGPSLGADSIFRGVTSIIIALVLIMIFMVFYYRLSGVNAVTALLLNILILMGLLAYFKANLTLPGIAGIILTIGMAVDANVLVFERIREELNSGKSVMSSIATGFSRAFRTILDANVTTIIAAVFLFQFGTGPIRGFAITLIMGITASMFTAVFVSRTIFDVTLSNKKRQEKLSI
ncbi:protein translocase subunit SecD [Acidobacteriota bacterium]